MEKTRGIELFLLIPHSSLIENCVQFLSFIPYLLLVFAERVLICIGKHSIGYRVVTYNRRM